MKGEHGKSLDDTGLRNPSAPTEPEKPSTKLAAESGEPLLARDPEADNILSDRLHMAFLGGEADNLPAERPNAVTDENGVTHITSLGMKYPPIRLWAHKDNPVAEHDQDNLIRALLNSRELIADDPTFWANDPPRQVIVKARMAEINTLADRLKKEIDYSNMITVSGRDILVVKLKDGTEQPFYRSSGVNSGKYGTWLPFDGFATMYRPGWFDKTRFTAALGDSTMSRFGNDELLNYSVALNVIGVPRIPEDDPRVINSYPRDNDAVKGNAFLGTPVAKAWNKRYVMYHYGKKKKADAEGYLRRREEADIAIEDHRNYLKDAPKRVSIQNPHSK